MTIYISVDDSNTLYHAIRSFVVYLDKSNILKLNYRSKFKSKEKKNILLKQLDFGTYDINYKNKPIKIKLYECGQPIATDDETIIHTKLELEFDDNDKDLIETFFEEASEYYTENMLDKKKELNKTSVYIWDDYWDTIEKRTNRQLSTIYLGGSEIEIFNKIKNFLSKSTKNLYSELGIPYKLNLLFHGVPGSGKSSLIYSLASELNMDIALLNFVKDLDDTTFMRAIRRLPKNSILVLEDIDVLFESRKKNDENKSAISFSGLLNTLDGIGHVDEQIIIMTTNCKLVLDKALTRPGRIDMDYEFKYATKDQIKTMYNKFIPRQKDNFLKFYQQIKRLKITTAILQQFLFGHIEDDNILDYLDELESICKNNNYEYDKEVLYT